MTYQALWGYQRLSAQQQAPDATLCCCGVEARIDAGNFHKRLPALNEKPTKIGAYSFNRYRFSTDLLFWLQA
jgi:hypothetical protein